MSETFVPEFVRVRVLPGVLDSAIDAIRSRRWVVASSAPLAFPSGQDLVLILDHFTATSASATHASPHAGSSVVLGEEPPPVEVILRRAHRDPTPGLRAMRLAPLSDGREGLLELLLLDDGRLWPSYRARDGRAASITVIKEFPARSLPDPSREEASPNPLLFPRTVPLLSSPRHVRAWSELHVAIIGVGRSGSLLADALCAQGVRRFTLIDDDILEAGNLDGMTLAGMDGIGLPKVVSVGRALCGRFPEIALSAIQDRFPAARSVMAAAGADVLVTTVDQDQPRLVADRLSRLLLQIHLDVGTAGDPRGRGQGADIRLTTPLSPCLLCLGGVADTREMLSRRAGNSSRGINAIAAHMAAQLLINAISDRSAGSEWLRIQSTARPVAIASERLTPESGHPQCPWCSGRSSTFGTANLGPSLWATWN